MAVVVAWMLRPPRAPQDEMDEFGYLCLTDEAYNTLQAYVDSVNERLDAISGLENNGCVLQSPHPSPPTRAERPRPSRAPFAPRPLTCIALYGRNQMSCLSKAKGAALKFAGADACWEVWAEQIDKRANAHNIV